MPWRLSLSSAAHRRHQQSPLLINSSSRCLQTWALACNKQQQEQQHYRTAAAAAAAAAGELEAVTHDALLLQRVPSGHVVLWNRMSPRPLWASPIRDFASLPPPPPLDTPTCAFTTLCALSCARWLMEAPRLLFFVAYTFRHSPLPQVVRACL